MPESPTCSSLRVIITGGSAGIGASLVRAFADAGHKVLFTYLTGYTRATKLAARYGSTRVTAMRLDQGNVNSICSFATTADQWAGNDGIDILINNAALGSGTVHNYVADEHDERIENEKDPNDTSISKQPQELRMKKMNGNINGSITPNGNGVVNDTKSTDAEMFATAANDEALMRVNALGPLWVTRRLEGLINRAAERNGRGRVIFIGSVGGGSSSVFPQYCPADLMSKAAVAYLAKHLAAQHVHDKIDVFCVSPGATETDMFRRSTLDTMPDVAAFVDGMPKRSLIQPEEIAQAVLWFATCPHARIFHGAVVDASMGLAVRPGLQTET